MVDMKSCLILLLAVLSVSSSLKVYSRSILNNDHSKKVGLRYQNTEGKEDINWKNGITICIRFRYEQLGTAWSENVLFSIGQSKSSLISFIIRWHLDNDFPDSPNIGAIAFRRHNETTFYLPWIGDDIGYARYVSVRIWHHLCLSFDFKKSNLRLRIVIVSSLKLFYQKKKELA